MIRARLPRPLPPELVARWEGLSAWVRGDAAHNTAIRDAIEDHVVYGGPIEDALLGLRDYLHGPGYAGPWPDDPRACFEILFALRGAGRRPMQTGGGAWGR